MNTISDNDKSVSVALAALTFGNITNIKKYLNLESYDAVAVVLRVASASGGDDGLAEAQLSTELGISRPTVNRMLKRLVDTQHLVVIKGSSPRRCVYRFEFPQDHYGDDAKRKRHGLQKKMLDRTVRHMLSVYRIWEAAHFDDVS